RSILLKGASLVRWLYEPEERRGYVDCDLLVPAADFERAGRVLDDLGFEPALDEAAMPDWWREHGIGWYRRDDRGGVGLPRTLPGHGVGPEQVWDVLWANTESLKVAGFETRALSPAGRALHVALHSAQHGGLPRHTEELARTMERTDAATWREAARLAADLD